MKYNDTWRHGDRTPENPDTSEVVSPADGRMKPFPVELLPEVVRDYVVESAEAIGVDVAMIAPAVLATLGGAIGTTRAVMIKKGWVEFPVLWVAIVCDSGAAKSPSLSAATDGIVKRQASEFHKHQKAAVAYEQAMIVHKAQLKDAEKQNKAPPQEPTRPRLRSTFTSDATVEALASLFNDNPRGLILILDELAALFGRMNQYKSGGRGADLQAYLSMHSSKSLRIDRKIGGVTFIPRAFLSIVGCATPEAFRRCLSADGNEENGLAARFLIVNPPRDLRRWSDAEVSEAVAQAFDRRVNQLLDLVGELKADFSTEDLCKEEPVFLGINAQGQRLLKGWVTAHGAEAVALRGPLAASWSKIEGACARLALILALAENPGAGSVNSEAIERAIGVSEWFKGELIRWYDNQKEAQAEAELNRLALWVKARGGEVTARELMRGPRPRPDSAEEAVYRLDLLAKSGRGEWREEKSPDGGRPTHVFVLAGDRTPENPENREVVSPVTTDEGEPPTESEWWAMALEGDQAGDQEPADVNDIPF